MRAIERQHEIQTELISYEELLVLYKELPFSLNAIITQWITSEKTTINKAAKGILNPHYGLKHNDATKIIIGANTKKLWDSDSDAKKRMIEGLRQSGLAQKGKNRIPREKRSCNLCLNEYTVMKTSTRIYCGRECSGNVAIKLATDVYVTKRKNIHSEIKIYIIQWTMENQELVLSTPYNKINSTIKPMTEEISRLYGIKDMRVISKAVFGIDQGRKKLLEFMKKLCSENVC